MTAPAHTPTDPDIGAAVDPDPAGAAASTGGPRPVHLRAGSLLLVLLGGTLGTGAREAISLAAPSADGIPYAILGINLTGAFLLGVLLDALARGGPDRGRRRSARLLLGTGVMGGFTTYSALAVGTATLLGNGAVAAGIGYGLTTVLVGAVATWAGIAVAAATHRRSRRAVR
ncbi:protein CrcB [Salana multivorans]|uniref:Fluoride-specific ion channel FluC n=1 Tax=Salana multivorans TaxID=120377 RepID=A0A3N2DD40_9MICO|nr:CrcB family protein [Salana multivorans]MBN8882720.1 CrcB family protein [Salana multivorans]ROR97701.1 protein CrcB [Salana multivorans]